MNRNIKNDAKTVKLWPLISMVCLILVGCGLCGNETGYDEAGNIFIAKGHSLIRMQWRSDTELLITYPPGTNVSLRQKQRDRVSIHYDESSTQ